MEAVPRMEMLSLELKQSSERAEFSSVLKKYISEHYMEDAGRYNDEIRQIEQLRVSACNVAQDFGGLSTLKKYYGQLHLLTSRFPMAEGEGCFIQFVWVDAFDDTFVTEGDVHFEQASILYNLGTLHAILGARESRTSEEEMKVACTHFQCAAGVFTFLKDHVGSNKSPDISTELLQIYINLMLGQAQECLLEKSMQDNRKSSLVARISSQVRDFYKLALKGLDDSRADIIVGSRRYKQWKKVLQIKIAHFTSIALMYMGNQAEEQQKYGDRVAYMKAALDKHLEAVKLAKGQKERIAEALVFTKDVVVGKHEAAKKDNDFIYHDKIPEIDSLPDIKGASLVKALTFQPYDVTVAGPDIFKKLVPMEAHAAASVYSEEKAKLLRELGAKIEEKNSQLDQYLESLQVDQLRLQKEPERLPQVLLEVCAAISVKPDAVKSLVQSMNELSNVVLDVDAELKEVQAIIDQEKEEEEAFSKECGTKPEVVTKEIVKELKKYKEGHTKASQSNTDLHKAMEIHLANIKLLGGPLEELQAYLPSQKDSETTQDQGIQDTLKMLIEKVEKMKSQRKHLEKQLRDKLQNDDITSVIVTKDEANRKQFFEEELAKHQTTVTYIEQNLSAQDNILKAVTEANAKYADTRKMSADIAKRREDKIQELVMSYTVYDDLLAKSHKGIDFYKKLQTGIMKIHTNCTDIVKDRRTQRNKHMARFKPKPSAHIASVPRQPEPGPAGPKLSDFWKPKTSHSSSSSPASGPSSPSVYPTAAAGLAMQPSSVIGGLQSQPSSMLSQQTPLSQPQSHISGPSAPPPSPARSISTTRNTSVHQMPVSQHHVPMSGGQSPASVSQTPTSMYQTPSVHQMNPPLQPPLSMQQTPVSRQAVQPISGSVHQPVSAQPPPLSMQYPPVSRYQTPVSGNQQPPVSIQQQPIHQPPASMYQPSASIHQPTASIHQPVASIHQPTASIHQPVASIHQPAASVHQPGASIHQPVASMHQPAASMNPISQQPTIAPQAKYQQSYQPNQMVTPSTQHILPSSSPMQQPYIQQAQSMHNTPYQPQGMMHQGQVQMNKPSQNQGLPQQAPTGGMASQAQNTSMHPQVYQMQQQPQFSQQTMYQTPQQMGQYQAQFMQQRLPHPQNQAAILKQTPGQANVAFTHHNQQPAGQYYQNQDVSPSHGSPQHRPRAPQYASNQPTGIIQSAVTGTMLQSPPSSLSQVPTQPDSGVQVLQPAGLGQHHPNQPYAQQQLHAYQSQQATVGSYPQSHPHQVSSQMNPQPQIYSQQTGQQKHPQTQSQNPQFMPTSSLGYQPKQHTNVGQQMQHQSQQSFPNQMTNQPIPQHHPTQSVQQKGPQQTQGTYPNQHSLAQQTQGAYPNQQPGAQQTQGKYPNQQPGAQQTQGTYLNQPPGAQQSQNTYPNQQPGAQQTQGTYPNQQPGAQQTQGTYLNQPPGAQQSQSTYPNQQPRTQQAQGTYTNQQPGAQQIQNTYSNQQPRAQQTQATYPNQKPGAQQPQGAYQSQQTAAQQAPPHSQSQKPVPQPRQSLGKQSTGPNSIQNIQQLEQQQLQQPLQPTKFTGPKQPDLLSTSPDNQQKSLENVLLPKKTESQPEPQERQMRVVKLPSADPYDDKGVLDRFVEEVEKLEKYVEGLNKQTLSGPTVIDSLWKELMESQDRDTRQYSISVARCYSIKNSFPDFMPYDHNRVKLKGLKDDYVNASYLDDLTPSCPTIIATQAPTSMTMLDFWTMVYENQVSVIAMLLSKPPGKAKSDFVTYWPEQRGQIMRHGPISVTLQATKTTDYHVERLMTISHRETRQMKTFAHLQFTAWPEFGVPSNSSSVLQFVGEVLNYHRQQRNTSVPIIVHCNGGVGRTGTFCTILAGVQEILAGSGIIDVPQIIKKQRQQRKWMVLEKEQLSFCFGAILSYAEQVLTKREYICIAVILCTLPLEYLELFMYHGTNVQV
ncbi:tyrosine-protein phosphatase non-receptor type 23-like [Anneissia japonica]|uniref:tyrosine-protein phosphatase non-receptor type 23-like n=1 Tax=Anneissia japonica TaxID=1529436 RepID=UPI001425B080|nr:tyrosine-protein phosphatase non-receptor type 23-like [Anneissia japonica]